jgi:hypothetical protein
LQRADITLRDGAAETRLAMQGGTGCNRSAEQPGTTTA